jgi:hypothetical protein
VGANGDHFIDNGSTLDPTLLATQIQFAHFHVGAQMVSTATGALSAGEIVPVIGDIDQNGLLNGADLTALESALTNPAGYAAAHPSFTASDINFILDVNHDGTTTNADLQAEIHGLIIGSFALGPSPGPLPASSVPEPSAIVLLGLGAVLAGLKGRKVIHGRKK